MWNRLTKYLAPGWANGAEDGENAAAAAADGVVPVDEDAAKTAEGLVVAAIPVEARLRQVEVEEDEWILIDRNVEGCGNLDESWYVAPPACFTQPSPVHVETSPLEDLLIEHPSMSVYRSAGSIGKHDVNGNSTNLSVCTDKKQRQRGKLQQINGGRPPLAERSANLMQVVVAAASNGVATAKTPSSTSRNAKLMAVAAVGSGHHHHHHQQHRRNDRRGSHNAGPVSERAPRRATMRDLRKDRIDENLRIVELHSAQKMLEKQMAQSTKRNRLERSNKAREVSSGKGRRPRRQDRLRLNNSGANNNRKC